MQVPISKGGGGVGDKLFPAFDAESKSAKIPNSLYGWGGGMVVVMNFFQLLIPWPKSAKIPNSLYGGGEGEGWEWGGGEVKNPTANF